jgi:light-regulated signal transduction histidine kinase (bacteriophytochrome)
MANHEFESGFELQRWDGKSPSHVLYESFHELRDPIYIMVGYIHLLKSMDLPPEEREQIITALWKSALRSKQVIDSVHHYLAV